MKVEIVTVIEVDEPLTKPCMEALFVFVKETTKAALLSRGAHEVGVAGRVLGVGLLAKSTCAEPDPERPEPPRARRINYRCSRCGCAEQSGELPPSYMLQVYPLPAGWKLVPCPSCEQDDHLHCAVCVEQTS